MKILSLLKGKQKYNKHRLVAGEKILYCDAFYSFLWQLQKHQPHIKCKTNSFKLQRSLKKKKTYLAITTLWIKSL